MNHTPYHPGELEAQARAGVGAMAARVGRGVHDEVPPAAAAFLEQATLVVLATTDADGRPWASVLTGEPGLVTVPDPVTAVVNAMPAPGDPLGTNIQLKAHIGLLAPDLSTRRRMRLNGTITRIGAGSFSIGAEQVYSNCPKYIQRRITAPLDDSKEVEAETGTSLSESQREWLRKADTFFVATANPGEGADASHRGGTPGFIKVADNVVRWPDYSGNMMFNTIGNVLAHPWAGIAVPDFAAGNVLLLSGKASIDWTPSKDETASGAERVVQLEVDRVVELRGALRLWSGAPEYSPFNPPLGPTV